MRHSRVSAPAFRSILGTLTFALAAAACNDSSGPRTTPPPPPPPIVDDRLVAYASTAGDANGMSINVMHADGTSRTRLTSDGFVDVSPVWSPDGSSIAFESDREPAGIWIMRADGSNQHPLVTLPAFDLASGITFSPDGSKIAFSARVDGAIAVFVADSDGSHAHRLRNNPLGEDRPSWSPDGSKIAFEGRVEIGDLHIFAIGPDGAALQQLTSDAFDVNPHWSPDGTQITFDRAGDGVGQIYVMSADGSNLHALTSSGSNFGASWSPDGRQFEYSVVLHRRNQVYRMNVDGSDTLAITTDSTITSIDPAWKPTP
jgi:TolB protein